MGDTDTLAEIQAALAVVDRTLDALTSRGDDTAAFELSKAHFNARVRTSWPASLAPLVTGLERVRTDGGLKLTDTERADLSVAITVFRRTIDS